MNGLFRSLTVAASLGVYSIITPVASAQHRGVPTEERSAQTESYRIDPAIDAGLGKIREADPEAFKRITAEIRQAQVSYAEKAEALKKAVEDYNAQTEQLAAQRPAVASQTEFINNVISLRDKSEMDKKAEELRKKWDAEYGPRIGLINPYTGESYYRYYREEKKDENGKPIKGTGGDLMVTLVKKGGYEALERQRQDWEKAYQRAQYQKDDAQRRYQEAIDQWGVVKATESKAAGELVQIQKRIDEFARQEQSRRATANEQGFDLRTDRVIGGGTGGSRNSRGGAPYKVIYNEFTPFGMDPNISEKGPFQSLEEARRVAEQTEGVGVRVLDSTGNTVGP